MDIFYELFSSYTMQEGIEEYSEYSTKLNLSFKVFILNYSLPHARKNIDIDKLDIYCINNNTAIFRFDKSLLFKSVKCSVIKG